MPLVSIVTPTFNRAEQLRQALSSVLTQSVYPCEHIICDNLSTDDTTKIVKDYAANSTFPVIHLRERDNGIYHAMNGAIRRSVGGAIYVLNDDDKIHGTEVLKIFASSLGQLQLDLIYGDTVWVNNATGEKKYRRHNQVNKMTLVQKAISQQAVLYSRQVFEKCGLFDESFRIAGDYEWLLRAMLKHRIAAGYLKRPMAFCSLGGMSNSDSAAELRRSERRTATDSYYTPREIELAGSYRGWIRKIPLGTTIFNLFCPLRLNIRRVSYRKGCASVCGVLPV